MDSQGFDRVVRVLGSTTGRRAAIAAAIAALTTTGADAANGCKGGCPKNEECKHGKCRCKWVKCNGECCNRPQICFAGACNSAPSDATLKTSITPLTGGLDAAMALRPVSFDWKSHVPFGETREIGFLAQEVREVVPEVIIERDGQPLAIDYGKLTAVLVDAVQELAAENRTLAARMAAIEAGMSSAS
ncbi:MAG: tail fiber domain-containing protein [Chloroflexota bacterium]